MQKGAHIEIHLEVLFITLLVFNTEDWSFNNRHHINHASSFSFKLSPNHSSGYCFVCLFVFLQEVSLPNLVYITVYYSTYFVFIYNLNVYH